jgi:hypothetical protein
MRLPITTSADVSIQELLFKQIRLQVPSYLSFVDEIAEVLDISTDSAYRRMRCEKELSLEEAKRLALHFSISIDQFLDPKTGPVLFRGNLADSSKKDLADWLMKTSAVFKKVQDGPDSYLYHSFWDAPFCIFLQIQELAMFKYFFWQKTILNKEHLRDEKFTTEIKDKKLVDLGAEVISIYNQIPGAEIWTRESLVTTLSQIEYYKDSGIFKSKADVQIIYDQLEELVRHYEKQAELGIKFDFGKCPSEGAAPFQMLYNETSIWNNCALGQYGDKRMAIVNQGISNTIETTDTRFTQDVYNSIQNLIKKSTQISVVGEKERLQFFNCLRGQIHTARQKRA